eukprot:CAMPEP_0205914900 /NCGR_PEP_ID=MMETSP1325-20131115/7513_1 /ASSEMBLY_ACC=CAM_ASM_000708 /TAXON_ID=236786 /ORGANISM="Florenciella sp., Strain RCC1007" /LENGTH=37 /DNA_ID= /DNA_START= /DNA_END= /DNA_ORIENTATION=
MLYNLDPPQAIKQSWTAAEYRAHRAIAPAAAAAASAS